MQSEDSTFANAANYVEDIAIPMSYDKEYAELQILYYKHRSTKISSTLHMPKMWAPHVLRAVKDILQINHNVRFVDIREENAKLVLNLHYPNDYDENIRKKICQIKNFIDIYVHAKMERYEVVRKFTHETPQYYY
jgi:hypothetical protein